MICAFGTSQRVSRLYRRFNLQPPQSIRRSNSATLSIKTCLFAVTDSFRTTEPDVSKDCPNR